MTALTRSGLVAAIAFLGAAPARADLVINEILASNRGYVVEAGTPDLVEIFNTGPDAVALGDVGGRMALTDDPYGDPRRFWHFPVGTLLGPGECLTVACDASGRFGMHANFRLDAEGDTVALIDGDERTIIDMVRFHRQYTNISCARIPDGSDTWKYTNRPTFFFREFVGVTPACFDNVLPPNPAVFCQPPSAPCPDSCENVLEEAFIPDISGDDYWPPLPKATDDVVVIGRVSPGPDQVAVKLIYWTAPSDDAPDDAVWVDMHDDGEGPDAVIDRQGRNVGAGDGWWTGVIPAQPAGTTVRFRLTSRLIARGEPKPPNDPVPDPCQDWEPAIGHAPNLYTVGNADPHGLRVNEVLARNDQTNRNRLGRSDDWVEIYNPSGEEVDLAGYYLTGNPRQPLRWPFPGDRADLTRIPPGGHVLVWLVGPDPVPQVQGELHADFALNGRGDRVYLGNAKGVFDGIDFLDDPRLPGPCDLTDDEQDTDISIGRVPDGSDAIARFKPPTPAAPNPAGPAPVIDAIEAVGGEACFAPCGGPGFAILGENLAAADRVEVDLGCNPLVPPLVRVPGDGMTLEGEALIIDDDRCGCGRRRTVWVSAGYQAAPEAFVAAKARFHCVPQITGVEPAGTEGDELITLAVCGFDRIQSVTLDGEPVNFTPLVSDKEGEMKAVRGVPPEVVSLWLPPCSDREGRVEIVDVDGYAQAISLCGVPFIRGDASADGRLDLGDPILVLEYLFSGGSLDCVEAADSDDDGLVVLGDPIHLLNYLFSGEWPPAVPFPDCGPDPTDDDQTCGKFDICGP